MAKQGQGGIKSGEKPGWGTFDARLFDLAIEPIGLERGAQPFGLGTAGYYRLQPVNRTDIDLALDHPVPDPGERIGAAR